MPSFVVGAADFVNMRQNTKFHSALNDITLVQSRYEKYFYFYFSEIMIICRIPPRHEGRFATVTDVETGTVGRSTSQRAFARRRTV